MATDKAGISDSAHWRLNPVREQYLDRSKDELLDIAFGQGLSPSSSSNKGDLAEMLAIRQSGVPVGEVLYEGDKDREVKGPGPEWEKDEDGGYANRD